jgi:outer membrane receptor protein involved in Fe transport
MLRGRPGLVVFCICMVVSPCVIEGIAGQSRAAAAAATAPDSTSESPSRTYGLDTVVVIGTRLRDPVSDPSTELSSLELSTSRVGREDIVRQGAKTVTDALAYLPGARTENRGRKVKQFFSLRGQVYPYPDYALDGAWQREFHEIPYFLPSAEIERIEVIRSSAALLKSPFGQAGVVNIVPRTYTQRETTVDLEYGAESAYRLGLSHGGTAGRASYAIGIHRSHTDGPANRNAEEGMTGLRAGGRWELSRKLVLQGNCFYLNGSRQLAQAVPPAAPRYQNAVEEFNPFRATLVTIKMQFRPHSRASTDLRAYYSSRNHAFVTATSSPATATAERDREWGIDFIQALALSRGNSLRLGGLYNHWVAPNGKRFYLGRRVDLETFSAVAVDEHQFGRLRLDAGLRWTRTYVNEYGAFNISGSPRGLTNVAPTRNVWEPYILNGSAGLTLYQSQRQSMHLNLSLGALRPRTGTLDVDFEEPERETRIKLDAGIRRSSEGGGRLSVTGFVVHLANAIVLSGKTATLDERVMELYTNRDQRQHGVEIEAHSDTLLGQIRAFVNLTAIWSMEELDGMMVRNREQPRVIIGGGLSGATPDYDFSLFWKSLSAYESIRFADSSQGPPLPQPLGGFVTLSATLSRTFGNRKWTRLYLEMHNLTNREYSTVIGYPDAGRRLTVGLRKTFR